jgi:ABC-type microcin C transport system duplicated ATPase subunit YejF
LDLIDDLRTLNFAITDCGSGASGAPALLSIRNVAKRFGKNVVLRDISLDVAEGEFLTILGGERFGQDHAAANYRRL